MINDHYFYDSIFPLPFQNGLYTIPTTFDIRSLVRRIFIFLVFYQFKLLSMIITIFYD